MKIKLLCSFLSLIFLLALSPCSLYSQEETTFSDELGQFADELENNSDDIEEQAIADQTGKDAETELAKEELQDEILYGEDGESGVMGDFDKQTGGQGERLMTDAGWMAESAITRGESEDDQIEDTSGGLTDVSDLSFRGGAYEEVELDLNDSLQSEYVLDYEIDQIETLLDQKLDLMDGILTADIPELDINTEYGFNTTAWDTQTSAVTAQSSSIGEVNTNGTDITDENKAMVTQEAKNMALLYDDVIQREEMVTAMVEKSQTLAEQGGVEIILDDLGDEVTKKLLDIDRKILDVLTEDAYEKDMAANEPLLIHEITGLPLKGYAKRKALKELNGPYGQVEAMRARNLEGDVLSESEILGVMMSVYDGYDPYAY